MKKTPTFFLLSLLTLLTINPVNAQVGMYMPELIGNRFRFVLDKETGEFRTYRFVDEDGDGWASGVQDQYMPVNHPEEGLVMAPMVDDIFGFEIDANESCGNCMTFKLENETEKYFVVDHEEATFWIQETDKTFSKFGNKYELFVMPGDEVTEGGGGPSELTVTAPSDKRHMEWPEESSDDCWMAPGKALCATDVVSVSSVLPEDENFDYVAENAFDDNPNTTWFSNPAENPDYPNGESIVFNMEIVESNIWILNGMQFSTEDFDNNSRVKTMTIFVNDEEFGTVTLLDQMGPQQIDLDGIYIYQESSATVKIEFRIIDVYPGAEYPEVGIAEIYSINE